MAANYTPMVQQYLEVKRQHQDELLFFRLGDFYEMFFDDALTASRELNITLTGRAAGLEERIPMCGVPYHSVDGYIAKLIKKGYRIAICEQVEDPKLAKGIVERKVIKIITPGTALNEQLLDDKHNRFLVFLQQDGARLCLVAADISTGECQWFTGEGSEMLSAVQEQLFRIQPAEAVVYSGIEYLFTRKKTKMPIILPRILLTANTVATPLYTVRRSTCCAICTALLRRI